MASAFPPEFRLAAACSKWPPSDCRNEAIRAAAASPLDWPRFLRVARRHGVVGLAHDGLRRARVEQPPQIAEAIDAQAVALVRNNIAMAAETLRLQRLFDEADLPVLFVKGSSLALLAFGSLALRTAQDIDLLISRDDLAAAMALVVRAGYHRFDPPSNISDAQLQLLMSLRKDLGYAHEAMSFRIELHWRLFLNPHAMAEKSLMPASRVVLLAGTAGLRTLGEEDLFAYLCVHGALHSWNRLKWLADVNALLADAAQDKAEHLIHEAEIRGAGDAAALAMLLCHRVFGTPLSDSLMAKVGKHATVRWLEATALTALTAGCGEREPREFRFGTTRGSLSSFLLRGSWRYKIAELKFHLTNQTDVLTVPLPRSLRFLYPILRLPLWAWRHCKPS
jgi:hypothetical protein